MISPSKSQKKKESSINQAAYHTFNFNKFPLKTSSPSKYRPMKSLNKLTAAENRIIDLVHTISQRPTPKQYEQPDNEMQSGRAKTSSRRANSQNKQQAMYIFYNFSDILNPLFDLGYFHKNRKQMLRIEKESRMKPIVVGTPRAGSGKSSIINRSGIY